MERLTRNALQHLLHNKFVVIIGGSVMRAVYKDLVHLLQYDELVPQNTLKMKGEQSFSSDTLVHGGIADGPLHNGKNYCEVRQYCTRFHLVRFYFVTRCFSENVADVLEVLKNEPFPDVVIMNSCLWDLTRYGPRAFTEYKRHLEMLFVRIRNTLQPSCLFVWATTPPIGAKLLGGCLPSNDYHNNTLRFEVQAANFLSAQMADDFGFRILDMHSFLMHVTQWRVKDGIHWNPQAHRYITTHIVQMLSSVWDTPDFRVHFEQRMVDENANAIFTEEEDRYGGPIRAPYYMEGPGGMFEHFSDEKDYTPRFAGTPPNVKRPKEYEEDAGLGRGLLVDCLAQSASTEKATGDRANTKDIEEKKEAEKEDEDDDEQKQAKKEEKLEENEEEKSSATGKDAKQVTSPKKKDNASPSKKSTSSSPKSSPKKKSPEGNGKFKQPVPVKKPIKRLQSSLSNRTAANQRPRGRGKSRGNPRMRSVSCMDQLLTNFVDQLHNRQQPIRQQPMPMGNSFSNRGNMAPNTPSPQGACFNAPAPRPFFNDPPVPDFMGGQPNHNFIPQSPMGNLPNFSPNQASFNSMRSPCGPPFMDSPQAPNFSQGPWGPDFMRNPGDMCPFGSENSPQGYNWSGRPGMGGPGPMRGWRGGRHRPY